MSSRAQQLLEEALTLPPTERAEMVTGLLHSLDRPDPQIDELWVQESERRIDDIDSGRVQLIPEEEVFGELDSP